MMKKLLFLISSCLMILPARAEMKIQPNSFHDFAANNVQTQGSDLGRENLTAASIDWGTDANGEDGKETMSCLYIFFHDMAPEDVDLLGVSVSNPSMIVRKNTKEINRLPALEVFFESGNNLYLDLQHQNDNIGKVRIPVNDYKTGHVYGVDIQNAGLVSVPITSEPPGATVFLDGKEQPEKTPLTISNVKMGAHTFALSPADQTIANNVQEHTEQVTSSQRAFNFDMYKTKDVKVKADPKSAYITVVYNGQQIARGVGEVTIPKARYGGIYHIDMLADGFTNEADLQINDNVPSVVEYKVIGSKNVSFTAKQNNREVDGAQVVINGEPVGTTPYVKFLEFGKYEVSASYGGYTKSKKVKIGKKTNTILLKIPNKKMVGFNPFDVDYYKRPWGITGAYIHRYFNYKKDGKSTHYNWVGQEGESNGIQLGVAYQPYFAYGQGLATGLFWQGTFGSSDVKKEERVDKVSYNESALFLPIQYQFRLTFHRNFSLAVNAGMGFTYGLTNKFTVKNEDGKDSFNPGYGYNSDYDSYYPDKFDYSFLAGLAIQYRSVQLEGKYSVGLKNHKIAESLDPAGSISYKSSFLSVGLTILFGGGREVETPKKVGYSVW